MQFLEGPNHALLLEYVVFHQPVYRNCLKGDIGSSTIWPVALT